jgi:hypothetical protein
MRTATLSLILPLLGLCLALAACAAPSTSPGEPGGLYVHSGAEFRDFVGGSSASTR